MSLLVAALAVIGFVSIWFDKPANLTTAVGLVSAGLAFAPQKVVISLAGYFVILRSSTGPHRHRAPIATTGTRQQILLEAAREVLARLDDAGIGIASATFEITGLPEVRARLSS